METYTPPPPKKKSLAILGGEIVDTKIVVQFEMHAWCT